MIYRPRLLDRFAAAASQANQIRFAHALLGLLILSAAIVLIAGNLYFFRSSVAALDADEAEYWSLSGDLLSHHFGDPGRRTLGFPFILAVLRTVWPQFSIVQVAMAMLAATAPPLLALAVYRATADRTAALLAGGSLAVWPPQIFLSTSIYSEAIALPCFLVAIACMPKPGSRAQLTQWVATGLMFGVLAHIRTMYQLFLPVLCVAVVIDSRSIRRAAISIVAVLVGFLIVVLPWSYYISRELGSPTLLTANGGETLAGGLNPNLLSSQPSVTLERRTTWSGPGKWLPSDQTGYLTTEERQLSYGEQNKLLQRRTIAWVQEHPRDAIYLTARKLLYMWGIYPLLGNGLLVALFGNLPVLMLLALFVGVVATNPAIRARGARFYLVPLFVSAVAVISWGSWRFRQPADAAMLSIVAWGIASLCRSTEETDGINHA